MRSWTISWLGLSVLLAGCSSPGPAPSPAVPRPAPTPEPGPLLEAAPADTVPPEPEPEVPPPVTIESERELQMQGALRTWAVRNQRLHDLALPLLRSGATICRSHRAEFGFRVATLEEYAAADERRAGEAVLGIRSRPTVYMVIAGSAAERAGMRPGDLLSSVGTVAVREGRAGRDAAYLTMEVWREGEPLPIRLEREGTAVEVEVAAERVCGYSVSLLAVDEINAWATGEAIQVSRGMMRFAKSDLELQAVIAHEIAHNSERHRAAREQNRVLSGLRGAVRDVVAAESEVAPEAEFSRAQEREADYLGMYYLARAGIDTRDAALVWRRMAAEGAGSLREYEQASHPSTPERFLLLEAAHREIAAKREAGLPLLPNRRSDGALVLPNTG